MHVFVTVAVDSLVHCVVVAAVMSHLLFYWPHTVGLSCLLWLIDLSLNVSVLQASPKEMV